MKWAATCTATAAPQAAHAPPGSLLTRQLPPCRPVPQHSTKARHLRSLPSGPHLQELPAAGILLHTATATQSTGVGCCRCWGGAGGIERRLEGGHQVCRDAWVVGPRCHNVLQRHVGSSLREGSRTMTSAEAGSDRQHHVHAAHGCSLRALRVGCPCSQRGNAASMPPMPSRQHQHTHATLCSSLSGRCRDPRAPSSCL